MTTFTSNIQKGGALLDDARRLVEVWDLDQSARWNIAHIAQHNLLAKRSRARSDDILLRILGPRLIEPGPHVIEAMKRLLPWPRAFVEAYYFEASRDDALLAAFAEGPLYTWWEQGRIGVEIDQVLAWLMELSREGLTPRWSDTIQLKVARGLLAALRDFGVLTGAARKEFASPSLSLAGFGYAAFRLHEVGASSRALIENAVWRQWLLDRARVVELFHEAERHGLLRYSAAGSAVRVDWLQETLSGAVAAVA